MPSKPKRPAPSRSCNEGGVHQLEAWKTTIESTHPCEYHSKVRTEVSVRFKPASAAAAVEFVGDAGVQASELNTWHVSTTTSSAGNNIEMSKGPLEDGR